MSKLTVFTRNDKPLRIKFQEMQQVKDGVTCDVYEFIDDDSCDLGIVLVNAGSRTPLQKILSGDSTIEGFISGRGTLTVIRSNGEKIGYRFPGDISEVEVEVGGIM